MMLDYTGLKELAREMKCRVTDLLALAPGNDPFYADVPARAEAGQWFAECWERFGFRDGVHLRRIHYRLITQPEPILKPNGEPYLNTTNDWKYLGIGSLAARYLKLVPAAAFVDRRNPDPVLHERPRRRRVDCELLVDGEEPDFAWIPRDLQVPRYELCSFVAEQDYIVELWVEKSTENDVLVPLARRLGCNLVSSVGEQSETAARNAVGRAMDAGKPLRILYISDFDPKGRDMPVSLARKVEFTIMAAQLDVDITLDPIVLTPEQCEHYRLPRAPIEKRGNGHADRFEARFGEGATELDALESLHPGELAQIVEQAVVRYIDPTLGSRVDAAERELERHLDSISDTVLDRYAVPAFQARFEVIRDDLASLEEDAESSWRRIAADLEQEKPPIGPDDVPRPRPASPVDEPLFDSQRSYLSQIDAYRTWQGRS